MTKTHSPRSTQAVRIAAILLTLGLFTVGSLPTAGQNFPGHMHWVAHLAAYAAIGSAYGLGWPRQPAILVALFVATLGLIHETTEIITHSHVFETEDAIVNTIGAMIGVTIPRTAQLAISR